MTLSPTDRRVIRILGAGPRLSAREVARALWPDSAAWTKETHRHDGKAGAVGGTMPMNAGRILEGMRRRGLVTVYSTWSGQSLWSATAAGIAAEGASDE